VTKNEIGDKKSLTLWLLHRLNNTRRIALSLMLNDDAAHVEVASLVVRYAVRSYSTIICSTQSKLKIFKTVFDLTDREWLNLVGIEPVSFLVRGEDKLEESVDDLSALRRQHGQRAAGSGTLAVSQRSQVGSLSQDLSSMPRTLLGDALSAEGGASSAAPADRISQVLICVISLYNIPLSLSSLSLSRSFSLFALSFFLPLAV
jgi:hypothetical protein